MSIDDKNTKIIQQSTLLYLLHNNVYIIGFRLGQIEPKMYFTISLFLNEQRMKN